MVVHGNYLDDEEIAFVAAHHERMAVVYCPRTHHWFGHDPYPLSKMLADGVGVCLGTDGRGSSPDLSLLAEMRFVAQKHPTIPLDQILKMGTINGAKALGHERQIGSLEPGKVANLTIVELPNDDASDPHALFLQSDTPVVGSYFLGE
jgi:cytosine/adenosine deaminase-related metal-dependent hydrolase